MSTEQIVVVCVAFLLAGIVKGGVGMGLPPVAVSLMTLALPLPQALALMTVPTLLTNVWQAAYGGHFRAMFKRFWTLGATLAGAVLLSAWVLGNLGSQRAVAWLGVLLVLFAITALVAWRPRFLPKHEWWGNPLCGTVSGAIGGLTGIAAVPFLPYMQSLSLTKNELVQALGILFIFFTGALMIALTGSGALNLTNAAGSLAAAVPTWIGVWLGQKLRNVLPPEAFRKTFLVVLLGLGLHMARGLL